MEHLQRIHLFARADELERLVDYRANRDGCTAAGVAVEFGQYDAVEIETVVELLGRIDCVLTGHRIDHEERFARFDGSLDGRDLLHHLFIYGQTSGRIDDYRVEVVRPGVLDRILGNLYRVLVSLFGVDLHADLLPQNL